MTNSWSARCRAPLLWILFPLIAGYLFGYYGDKMLYGLPLSAKVFAGSGVVLAVIALVVVLVLRPEQQWLWPPVFFTSVLCLSCSYFINAWPGPSLDWKGLPPREVELTLKVTRVFNTAPHSHYRSGIATVIAAPERFNRLLGQRICFGVKTDSEAKDVPFVPSARFSTKGVLSYFDRATTSSSFHHYLNQRGVYFELKRGRMIKMLDPGWSFFRFCNDYNEKFESFLRSGSKGNEYLANIVVAMLLGKKGVLSDEQKKVFFNTGTFHFFAISGLHIGVIALIFFTLLALLRLPKGIAGCMGLLFVLLYVYITGASPSALRAFIMIGFFWCAIHLQRSPAFFSALVTSAVVVLLIDPSMLWNIGFQLSYSVVAGIFLYGLPLATFLQEQYLLFKGLPEESWQWYQRFLQRIWNVFLSLLAISLSGFLMSTPLTVHYFFIFPISGILLNIFMAPLASIAIISGMLSIFMGLLGIIPMTVFFNHGAWFVIWIMEQSTATLANIPTLVIQRMFIFPWIAFAIIFVLLALLTLWHSEERLRYRFTYILPFVLLILILILGSKSYPL